MLIPISIDKLYKLMALLARYTGSLINKNELATTLSLSASTVDDYLLFLNKTFIISMAKPFYKNLRKELTKMPKAFFLDLGIRNYLIGDFNSPELRNDKGELWENFYFKLISDKYPKEDIKFWRTQDEQEIDFVIERQKIAIEIKSNPLRRTKIPKLFQEAYPEFTTDVLYGMIDIARFF